MSKLKKISVLVPAGEAHRFEAYCTETGHKKSTLIVRLIREHLDRERFFVQGSLYEQVNAEKSKAFATAVEQ